MNIPISPTRQRGIGMKWCNLYNTILFRERSEQPNAAVCVSNMFADLEVPVNCIPSELDEFEEEYLTF